MGTRVMTENLFDATLVNATGAVSSGAINTKETLGDACAIYLVLSGAGTHTVDITQTVSLDGVTFVEPFDVSGTLGAVDTTVTATKWTQFVPALAPYIKITVTGTASNGVSTMAAAKLVRQTD